MRELRTRMENEMQLRGMSERTRESYMAAVARMARFYGRSPEQISEPEVQAYLLRMMQEEKLSWSTCNIAAHVLRFLYHVTLGAIGSSFASPWRSNPRGCPRS